MELQGLAEQAAIASGFLVPDMEMTTKPFVIDDGAVRIRVMIKMGPDRK